MGVRRQRSYARGVSAVCDDRRSDNGRLYFDQASSIV